MTRSRSGIGEPVPEQLAVADRWEESESGPEQLGLAERLQLPAALGGHPPPQLKQIDPDRRPDVALRPGFADRRQRARVASWRPERRKNPE